MTSFLPAVLVFAGWLLERRARKRAEARDAKTTLILQSEIRFSNSVSKIASDRLLEIDGLKAQNLALAGRVAEQSELLSRAAERQAESDRRLGCLFPRGLETPPSREDALSPTWCREEAPVGKLAAPPISDDPSVQGE